MRLAKQKKVSFLYYCRFKSFSRLDFTSSHSEAIIENLAESRGILSAASLWARRIPSNFPPIRSMAARERLLRISVCRQTRSTCHFSKASFNKRNFASVLAPVRMAELLSQVYPISQASGERPPYLGLPDRQSHRSRLKKRVEPMIRSSAILTITKGTDVPASRQVNAVRIYLSTSSFPCGTGLH